MEDILDGKSVHQAKINVPGNRYRGAKFEDMQKERLEIQYPNLSQQKEMITISGEKRKIDLFDPDTDRAFECKVGQLTNSQPIRDQLTKDKELLLSGDINEVTWLLTISPKTGKGGIKDVKTGIKKHLDEINKELEANGKKTIKFEDIVLDDPNILDK